MQYLNDSFVETIDSKLHLKHKRILEIGCGEGKKSVGLANLCTSLTAIDPSAQAIAMAKQNYAAKNLTYEISSAQKLLFDDNSFDVVIFSLSLHHVPVREMDRAIQEAARVLGPTGKIVFLEPAFTGGFFEAEIRFGAGDGDERKEKAAAYFEMLHSAILTEEEEYYDEIAFKFDSERDFIDNMKPVRNLDEIGDFLRKKNFTLHAQRRINIFNLLNSSPALKSPTTNHP